MKSFALIAAIAGAAFAADPFVDGVFQWMAGAPLMDVGQGNERCISWRLGLLREETKLTLQGRSSARK